MRRVTGRKLEPLRAGLFGWENAAGPPARGAVFHVGVERIPAPGDPQRDGVGGAPFVERAVVEKADQRVHPALGHDDLP